MAKEIAAQVGVWKKAVETVELTDTGNILTPLVRVGLQYLDRAAKHEAAGKPELAVYYREQANNIERLLAQ